MLLNEIDGLQICALWMHIHFMATPYLIQKMLQLNSYPKHISH